MQTEPNEPAPSPRSRYRHLWVVGLCVYAAAVWYVGWDALRGAFASLHVQWLCLMVAAMIASLWLRAMKWRWALGPRANAIGLFFLSKGAGGFSPARIGELAPLLLRRYRTPRLAAWIVIDRLVETGATLGLGLAAFIALGLPQRAVGIAFVVALIVLVIVPVGLLTRRAALERFSQRFPAGSLPRRAGVLLASVGSEIDAFRWRLPLAFGWSFACTCLDVVVGMLLLRSFGFSLSFTLLAVVQCAHGVASAMPFLPNATGGPYLVAAGLLYQFGGVGPDILAAAIGLNVAASNVLFWTSFVLGSLSLRERHPEPAANTTGNAQAGLFDYLASGDSLYVYEPESLARLDALVPHKGRLLDLGCGDGAIGCALTADAVYAADISFRCALLAGRRGLRAIVADALAGVPFAPGSFDTVYCIDIFHHLPGAWDAALGEIARVLRPGGRLVLVEPDARYAFVRWTQAPNSPIRVAPHDNEPAIDPAELMPLFEKWRFQATIAPIRIDGSQVTRSVFPLWQRLLKAPFVIALVWWHGAKPNKFAIVAVKPASSGAQAQTESA